MHQRCAPTHIDSNSKRGIERCKKNNELFTYTFDSAGNYSGSDIIFAKVYRKLRTIKTCQRGESKATLCSLYKFFWFGRSLVKMSYRSLTFMRGMVVKYLMAGG